MKTTSAITVMALSAGFLSFSAVAVERVDRGNTPQLIYQSRAANQSIFSYISNIPAVASLKPELIYVSQANGPAIHSYPHSGDEIVVPWNVEYVDTAYGPAIYSYDRPPAKNVIE